MGTFRKQLEKSRVNAGEIIRGKVNNRDVGFFIKEARIRLDHTLDEVANGICAPSYLSKIEAGLVPIKSVIASENSIFSQLIDRLQITIPEVMGCCRWVDTLKGSLIRNDVAIVKNDVASKFACEHQRNLNGFFGAVLDAKCQVATDLKKNLDKLEEYLLVEEAQVYYLFVGIYFEQMMEAVIAFEYYKLSLELASYMQKPDPYLLQRMAKHSFKIGKVYSGFSYLDEALDLFEKLYASKWLVECQLIWCKEKLGASDARGVGLMLERIGSKLDYEDPFLQYAQFLNVKALFYKQAGEFDLAEMYYLQSLNEAKGYFSEDSVVELAEMYLFKREITKMKKHLEWAAGCDLSLSVRNKIKYYRFKSAEPAENSNLEFEKFLQKEAINQAVSEADMQYLDVYGKSLISAYSQRRKLSLAMKTYEMLEGYKCEFSH